MSGAVPCPGLRLPPLVATQFCATPHASAGEKATMGTAILSFMARGMPEQAFTTRLYQQISQMWGFIACVDRHGFFQRYGATAAGRWAFIHQIVTAPCYGQAQFCWCDVEHVLAQRVRQWGLEAAYRRASVQERDAAEQAQLRQLLARHGLPPVEQAVPPPVQASLF